jgi:phage/plasmid-like protein (TIGR03299 family)
MPEAIMGTDYSIATAKHSPLQDDTLAAIKPGCQIDDLLEDPNLNWEVSKLEVFDPTGKPVFDSRVVTRDDTGQHLGLVSKRYQVVQNREALEFFRPIFDAGASIDCAGIFRGGRNMFIVANVDNVKPINVVKGDEHRPYIMLRHGHDGNTAIEIKAFSTRLACTNMFPLINRESKNHTLRIKHRRGAHEVLDTIGAVTAEALKGFTDSESHLKKLARKPVSALGLENYFRNVLKLPFRDPKAIVEDEEAYEKQMAEGKRKLEWLFQAHADEEKLSPSKVHGSLYHAFNAVTHHVTHDSPTKSDQSRFEKSVCGLGSQMSQRAYDLALELAA